MEINAVFALLLEPAEEKDTYRRIGIAEIPEASELASRGWEEKVLKVI